MTVTLLISGGLGEASLRDLASKHVVAAVFTDGKSEGIIAYCSEHGISCFTGNPRRKGINDFLAIAACEVLLSINYLYLVQDRIIELASRYAINFHGSLLPLYRGRTPHVWAIINGETSTGVTAHLMTDRMDAGAVAGRRVVPIPPEATGAEVLAQYHLEYPNLINEVLTDIQGDRVTLVEQVETEATYFPKRTPDDGGIDWDWDLNRVRNWIRAQAPPYPGAFFTCMGERHAVRTSRRVALGYTHETPNGTVAAVGAEFLTVKLCNGCLSVGPLPSAFLASVSIGTRLI